MIYTNPVVARTLLESSLAVTSDPILSDDQIETLFVLATGEDGETWTTESLSNSAAMGWRWKAGLASSSFELGGGGATLKENQMFDQCMKIAQLYNTGEWVVGGHEGGLLEPDPIEEPQDPYFFVASFLTPKEGAGGHEW